MIYLRENFLFGLFSNFKLIGMLKFMSIICGGVFDKGWQTTSIVLIILSRAPQHTTKVAHISMIEEHYER